jgi:hypothetical protein
MGDVPRVVVGEFFDVGFELNVFEKQVILGFIEIQLELFLL